MPQTPEAQSFLNRIAALHGPGVSLDHVLQLSVDDEASLRRLFATDKTNPRLSDPHVGLVDVFDAPANIRTTRARVVKDEEDLAAHHVMPLSESQRRKEGSPAMVASLDEFKRNWSIFTENSLSQLSDWSNVIVAGGAVLACLNPLPNDAKVSKKAIRKYFHSTAYPTSDLDLFLWGLTPEQAEVKINAIYQAVCDSVIWDVTCVRTKHTVSIHSQYPFRAIQIILRLYQSPAEVLAGFDVDAPCCAYDGKRVFANPRAIVAMMRQCNTVDMTRRSPSYEVRLAKYSARGFEVHIPTLIRSDVDPTIYERSIVRVEGLARLLVLEKLRSNNDRDSFLQSRRTLRGRANHSNTFRNRKRYYKGDLKTDDAIGGLEMNDYDVASLHIPYGPGWDARRIDKLIYQTDLGMNSTFNPKNKGRHLHRHPAFFGTIKECLEDCCEHCPDPLNDEEFKLQEEEDKLYIRGRISFIQEDPGRQSISGSFNPIDIGEWTAQTYVGQIEKFFAAIASRDSAMVLDVIKKGIDINRRDHVGRTPLQFAILSNAVETACDLIDAGARMTARLVDGRTSLHLAAQMDQLVVIQKLFERSAINTERVNSGKKTKDGMSKDNAECHSDRRSSQDDWSSQDTDGMADMESLEDDDDPGSVMSMTDGGLPEKSSEAKPPLPTATTDVGHVPDDPVDEPDVLDVNLPDWDLAFTPLMYAVLFSSLPVVEELLSAGADPKMVTKANDYSAIHLHPLTLTIYMKDEERAIKMAQRLLVAGASSSAANDEMTTIFSRAVKANNTNIVSTLLRYDPNAKTVLNFPSQTYNTITFPLTPAIENGNYSMLALMLAHGVKLIFTEEDISRAQAIRGRSQPTYGSNYLLKLVRMPAESAIAHCDDLIQLLAALNVDLNFTTKASHYQRRLLDWVRFCIEMLTQWIQSAEEEMKPPTSLTPGWKGYLSHQSQYINYLQAKDYTGDGNSKDRLFKLTENKSYFVDVERLLVARNAQSGVDTVLPVTMTLSATAASTGTDSCIEYLLSGSNVPQYMVASYDELYEACFTGNNEKVQQLCLPPEGTKAKTQPLQITVNTKFSISVPNTLADDHIYWYRRPNQPSSIWFSPLHAAIAGRKWQTARLIMAIATAQHVPNEEQDKFKIKDIVLELDDNASDTSGNSYDSEESDMLAENKVIDFTDVATRPSTIRCNLPPSNLLHASCLSWVTGSGSESKVETGNILRKAICDNDLEAFVHISDLYETLADRAELDTRSLLSDIMKFDRAEILDEYIRRSGTGIHLKDFGVDDEPEVVTTDNKGNQQSKPLYLGLSVHGEKRKDLAKKNDPNARRGYHQHINEIPLLWQAAQANAKNIVEYLCSDRPLAAYRFYCSTHSDELAKHIRSVPDLEHALPAWLGWKMTIMNESPLDAAILSNNLALVKTLFIKSPTFMAPTLHERVKFLGYNPLMVAVATGANADLVDYLIENGVSVLETELLHGWNIYHILCNNGHDRLLDHLLHKLPTDVTEALLLQQCKDTLNTPIHVAVQRGRKGCVKLLLEFHKLGLLVRNVDGCTPLHLAAQSGYAEIARLLVEASSTEGLHAENGVGETAIETATLQDLIWRTRGQGCPRYPNVIGIEFNSLWFDLPEREAEITQLRKTLDQLLQDGRLKKGTKVTTELLAFTVAMEAKLATAKSAQLASPVVPKSVPLNLGGVDREGTLRHIREGVSARPGLRGLVHLIDVRKSVERSLKDVEKNRNATKVRLIAGRPELNEDSEDAQKRSSLVYKHVLWF